MEKKQGFFRKYGRLLLLIGILAAAIILVWVNFGNTLPEYIRLLQTGDEVAIKAYISDQGVWKGAVTIILLSALQVISIVFPGFAIQIAAGALYGWWQALLMCYCGFILGNCAVFIVARRMGSEIQGFAAKKKNKHSWIREKMKTTRPSFIVALLNLIPLIPNGIIPYMAAGSSITFLGFFGAIAIASWVQILFNCLAGNFLKNGQYVFMVLALSVQIVLVIIVAKKRKQIMALIPGGMDKMEEDEPDVKEEVTEEVKEEVKEEVTAEDKEEVRTEVEVKIEAEIEEEVRTEVEAEVKAEAAAEDKTEAAAEDRAEAAAEDKAEATEEDKSESIAEIKAELKEEDQAAVR
ncbi:MAG: VTT domain-containing protein [Eubacterium sp.]|nr:VTT domain-containing protein [Eubacterium sp.]